MAEQGVVVAIRLSDVAAVDQPDPLSLRAEDLSKWRHLEVMLQSMYKDPPQAIRVTYKDNEDDWVQISCDEELAEAVKITQETNGILSFQVKRLNPPVYYESTLPPASNTAQQRPFLTQAEENSFRNVASQPLVYPHPSNPTTCGTVPDGYEPHTPLIYPHPVHSGIQGHTPQKSRYENVMAISANGKTASIEGRPDLSTDQKIARVKSMISAGSTEAKQNAQGLNCLNSGAPWEQASCLPTTEKLNFLKQMISHPEELGKSQVPGEAADGTKPKQAYGQGLLMEPLCPGNDSLGKNMLANQDPFETVSSGRPSADLEQVHLPTPTLTPLKTQNVSLEIDADGPKSDNVHLNHQAVRPSNSLVARSSHQQPLAHMEKMKIGKTPVTPPVPLPRTLQMMEGAQSGANAVAIEIPDSYHGAAHKEEDVTASGGASCTSASAETGEIAQDGSHHAAAVGREMRIVMDPSAVSTINSGSRVSDMKVLSIPKKQLSESKKKSESRKSDSRAKKKESSGKESSSSRKKSSSEKIKKDTASLVKKEDKLIKADVESGEKTVSTVKSEASTPYKDLVKYMRRMKKELHSNIVKDVAKQTDKLMKKNFERSMSCDAAYLRQGLDMQPDVCHKGIVCDCCNNVIYGIRYKCGNCADFDLCAKCEILPGVHDQSHLFLKMRRPVRNVPDEAPLLRKNIYNDGSRVDSISEESSDEFTQLSRQSSVDVCTIPKDDPSEEEVCKWFWDSFGTEHSAGMTGIESMPKLSRSEMAKLYKMMNSQEEAEDLTVPKRDFPSPAEETVCKASSAPTSYTSSSSVKEEVIKKETTKFVQAERAMSIENVDSGEAEQTEMQIDVCSFESAEHQETSEYKEIGVEEDNGVELEEFEGSLDENFNVTEEGNLTNDESDSSDDFCVIEPPSREEFEACGLEFSSHSDLLMPMVNHLSAVENLQCVPDWPVVEIDSVDGSPLDLQFFDEQDFALVPSEDTAAQVRRERSQPPSVTVQEGTDTDSNELTSQTNESECEEPIENACGGERISEMERDQVSSTAQAEAEVPSESGDCAMEINDQDRKEHSLMLETLKMRLKDLEREMKRRGDETSEAVDEKDVQLILQAKQKKAAMENEKLEMMKMTEVAEKLKRWQSVQGDVNSPQDEKIRLQQEKDQHFQEFTQKRAQDQEQTGVKPGAPTPDAPASSPGDLGNVSYQQTKKDADCQTNPNSDPATQASQMLQQFTHGVSKAATSAFSTAKDVIYSLQAKQFEKKSSSSCQKPVSSTSEDSWTPPAHVWTPPKNDYVPPKSDWTPPKQDWTPPKQDWTPPKSWTPPKLEDKQQPVGESKPAGPSHQNSREDNNSRQSGNRQQRRESTGHSQDSPVVSPTTAPLALLPVADSALGQERLAMQRLMEMGFANREQNRKLLQQFDGDLERVVQSLLQEEGGEHWSFNRH